MASSMACHQSPCLQPPTPLPMLWRRQGLWCLQHCTSAGSGGRLLVGRCCSNALGFGIQPCHTPRFAAALLPQHVNVQFQQILQHLAAHQGATIHFLPWPHHLLPCTCRGPGAGTSFRPGPGCGTGRCPVPGHLQVPGTRCLPLASTCPLSGPWHQRGRPVHLLWTFCDPVLPFEYPCWAVLRLHLWPLPLPCGRYHPCQGGAAWRSGRQWWHQLPLPLRRSTLTACSPDHFS